MEELTTAYPPSVSPMKTTEEIAADLEAKARQSAELTAQQQRMMLESDEAQTEIVTANVLFESKQSAADEDTWRKTHRILFDTVKELDHARKTKKPDTDIVVLVLTIDNTRIEPNERIGQKELVERIKQALPNEFQYNRWRIASLSAKHDTLNPATWIGRDKSGLLSGIFTQIQAAHTNRARNVYPKAFKSPERPNRDVQPRYPYQPGLHIDPEIN